jgi:hypothetical protein
VKASGFLRRFEAQAAPRSAGPRSSDSWWVISYARNPTNSDEQEFWLGIYAEFLRRTGGPRKGSLGSYYPAVWTVTTGSPTTKRLLGGAEEARRARLLAVILAERFGHAGDPEEFLAELRALAAQENVSLTNYISAVYQVEDWERVRGTDSLVIEGRGGGRPDCEQPAISTPRRIGHN